ncbi:MAG: hypothetical protein KDC27_17745, partial [Acidobacteria bacterium]|nr:hypothetical protein [Acidobacteriota bacterium]
MVRLLCSALLLASLAFAQDIPRPPKADTPYLIHAGNLVETEASDASDVSTEKAMRYAVEGATSTARTPLALPEFALAPESLDPGVLELYRFEPVNGRREILLKKKKKVVAEPYHLTALPSQQKGVYRLRVAQTLSPGEYCLTPQGANQVFCFTVF